MTGSQIRYLLTISVLVKERGAVRSADVADALGVSKPSVTVALRKLEEERLVCREERGSLILTEAGKALCERYARCAACIEAFLKRELCSSPNAAKYDALEILGCLSEQNFKNLCKRLQEKSED